MFCLSIKVKINQIHIIAACCYWCLFFNMTKLSTRCLKFQLRNCFNSMSWELFYSENIAREDVLLLLQRKSNGSTWTTVVSALHEANKLNCTGIEILLVRAPWVGMKPPPRTRSKSVRRPEFVPQRSATWQRPEQRKLLHALKRLRRAEGNGEIDYAYLRKGVLTRSVSEVT